jgi:hypothetical protein
MMVNYNRKTFIVQATDVDGSFKVVTQRPGVSTIKLFTTVIKFVS